MKGRMGLAALALGLVSLAGSAVPAVSTLATSNSVADDYIARVCVTVTPKSVSISADDITIGETVSQPTTCVQV